MNRIVTRLLVSVGVVLVCAGCMTAYDVDDGGHFVYEVDADGPAFDPKGILDVLERQQLDWNRGDIEAFMAGYEASELTTFASASGTIRGWDAVLARYRETYGDGADLGVLHFSGLAVVPLARSAALVRGEWHLNRGGQASAGVFSLVFRRTSDGWKIVHDHTSRFPDDIDLDPTP